jgi:hypothetical protein
VAATDERPGVRLTREELQRLRTIERYLALEEPELDRKLSGRSARRSCLMWAKVLGVVWFPLMLAGDATREFAFAIAGITTLLAALTLAMIADIRRSIS